MKKSKLVTLGLLALIAATVACDEDENTSNANEEVRHCVNADGVVVDEANCNVGGAGDAGLVQQTDKDGNIIYVPSGTVYVNDGPPPIIFYHWYYGGWSRPVPLGTRIIVTGPGVTGGSWHPSVGHTYSSPSNFGRSAPSMGRGGFGGTGKSFSGGRGGGAGE